MATKLAIARTPAEAIIGPYRYRIGFDCQAAYDYGYYGVALYRSKRINLDPMQADTELPQTLLHELIHALGHAHEIKEWDRHKTDTDGRVTDMIDMMASALLTFIRENPKIVRWLQTTR